MKVILYGATGMVGQGVLRECLLCPDVESVLSIGRRETGQKHPKLREVAHSDFADFTPLELVPSVASTVKMIERGKEELAPELPFIRRMLQPLPPLTD